MAGIKCKSNLSCWIKVAVPLLAALLALGGGEANAATYVVDRFDDPSPIPQACTGAASDCSLRGAVRASNATNGVPDTITVPAGTYTLELDNTGGSESRASLGDLDINDDVTVNGAGSGSTIVQWVSSNPSDPTGTDDVRNRDRIFEILSNIDLGIAQNLNVSINGMTLRNGYTSTATTTPSPTEAGGAINVNPAGSVSGGGSHSLSVNDVLFQDNNSRGGNGGAISIGKGAFATIDPTLTVTDCVFTGNVGIIGGAISSANTNVIISNSTFDGNTATVDIASKATEPIGAGAIYISGDNNSGASFTRTITKTDIINNTSTRPGGGVGLFNAPNVVILYSRFAGNTLFDAEPGSDTSILFANSPTYEGVQATGLVAENTEAHSSADRTVTLENNWWGCGDGPGTTSGNTYSNPPDPCNRAVGYISTTTVGTQNPNAFFDVSPWITLFVTPAASPIHIEHSTLFTADITKNSDGTQLDLADLDLVKSLPITFNNPVLGLLNSSQTSVSTSLSNGQATVTYTAGSLTSLAPPYPDIGVNNGMFDAVVDGDPTTGFVSLEKFDATISAVSRSGSSSPTKFGQNVTFTVTVQPDVDDARTTASTPKELTGNVQFKAGGVNIGSPVPISESGGVYFATLTYNLLPVGTHGITAVYNEDDLDTRYKTSGESSPALTHVVEKADTATDVSRDDPAGDSVFGQAVTFRATITVTPPGTDAPADLTGTVQFKDGIGGTDIGGAATISKESSNTYIATVTTTTLSVAAHTITAVYSGDGSFNGSNDDASAFSHTVEKADTTTDVTHETGSSSPSVFGQPVTFKATITPVSPGSGADTPPGGTVTFKEGAATLPGTVSTSTSGGSLIATLTIDSLSVAAHTITAVYDGDGNFNGSNDDAAPLSHTVNKADTTTSVVHETGSSSPTVFGEPVTFRATVSPAAPGAGTNAAPSSGTVTFSDNGTPLTGTVSYSNSGETLIATLTVTSLSVAAHDITAQYSGDGNFNGSDNTSAPLSHTVDKADTTTTLGYGSGSSSPTVFGQAVTLKATVTPVSPGSGTGTPPSGTVTFFDDGTALAGTVNTSTSGGVLEVTLDVTTLSVGSHANLTVEYSGDGSFNGSTSAALSPAHEVNKADTETVVSYDTGSSGPTVFGEAVTFKATVSPVAPGTGTNAPPSSGTVTFSDNGTPLAGTVSYSNSGETLIATLTVNDLAVSPPDHVITATYSGDSNFEGSTGGGVTHAVNKAPTTTDVASSQNPALVGETVTFTATVTPDPSNPVNPEGSVEFFDGATSLGTATLSGGTATLDVSTLAAGSHSITAVYAGNENYLTSTSTAFDQEIVGAVQPGQLLISEFRTRGASGENDEFIELYNNTDDDLVVLTSDGSSGWAVAGSDGIIRIVIPEGTVLPARKHYLIVNSLGYSLGAATASDADYSLSLPTSNIGIAVFSTATVANFDAATTRLDAVGYNDAPALYREGVGLTPGGAEMTSNLEYSFFRKLDNETPQDTNVNEDDFQAVDTAGTVMGTGQRLGAPGPENLGSPLALIDGSMPVSLLDANVSATLRPNRRREATPTDPNHSAFGIMTIRRTITNNTTSPIEGLRLRFVTLTTLPAGAGEADFRLLSAPDDPAVDLSVASGGGTVAVSGTTLEEPPTQPLGGGLNSTLAVNSVTPDAPLGPGESVNVQVRFGVQTTGNYNFRALLEASFGSSTTTGSYQLLRGDVNLDRRVDVTDAVLTLRSIVGFAPLDADERFRADLNADGQVDVADVVLLLQWAAGIGLGLEDNIITSQGKVGTLMVLP